MPLVRAEWRRHRIHGYFDRAASEAMAGAWRTGCFADPRFEAFLRQAAEAFQQAGQLWAAWIEHAGRPIAATWRWSESSVVRRESFVIRPASILNSCTFVQGSSRMWPFCTGPARAASPPSISCEETNPTKSCSMPNLTPPPPCESSRRDGFRPFASKFVWPVKGSGELARKFAVSFSSTFPLRAMMGGGNGRAVRRQVAVHGFSPRLLRGANGLVPLFNSWVSHGDLRSPLLSR